MNKLKIGVIFGGMSTEHDVSVVSGTSVIKKINMKSYQYILIKMVSGFHMIKKLRQLIF